jgi:hypothetical protein
MCVADIMLGFVRLGYCYPMGRWIETDACNSLDRRIETVACRPNGPKVRN